MDFKPRLFYDNIEAHYAIKWALVEICYGSSEFKPSLDQFHQIDCIFFLLNPSEKGSSLFQLQVVFDVAVHMKYNKRSKLWVFKLQKKNVECTVCNM